MSFNVPLALAMIVAGTALGEAIVLMVNEARAHPRMSLPEAEAPPKPQTGVTISKVRPR
jgi:hypothetical protein